MPAAGMSWEHLVSWALRGGPAPVQLTDVSVARIAVAEEQLRLAGRSGAVYGLTTGVGALRTVPRPQPVPDDGSSPGLRLWRSHATRDRRDLRRRDRPRRHGDPPAPDHLGPVGRQLRPRVVAR